MNKKTKRGRRAPDESRSFEGGAASRRRYADARLCAQIERTLRYSLAEVPDDALLGLTLLEVVPDGGRYAVRLLAPHGADLDRLRERLDASLPRLRHDVAAAIHRKKVPTLFLELFSREAFDGA